MRKLLCFFLLATMLVMTGCHRKPSAPVILEPDDGIETPVPPEGLLEPFPSAELVFQDYNIPELGFVISYPKNAMHGPAEENGNIYSFHHEDFPMVAIVRTQPPFALPLDESEADALLQQIKNRYQDDLLLSTQATAVSDDIWVLEIVRDTETETGPIRVFQRFVAHRDYIWEIHIPVAAERAMELEADVLHILNSFALLIELS